MKIISLNQVSKGYRKETLLENVSLEITENEIHVIFGVSGSGKTTLLNLISHTDKQYQGVVCHHKKLHIEYVTQFPHFIQELNVYQNLQLSAYQIPKMLQREKIDYFLSVFGCLELKNRKICQLSGGEKQRLSVVRALLNQPDLLILDEPTSSLDQQNKLNLIQVLQDIRKEHSLAMILVTHDRELIQLFCQENSHCYELKEKRLIKIFN